MGHPLGSLEREVLWFSAGISPSLRRLDEDMEQAVSVASREFGGQPRSRPALIPV